MLEEVVVLVMEVPAVESQAVEASALARRCWKVILPEEMHMPLIRKP